LITIHSPQEIIALYQSVYRQTIASGTGHSPFAKNLTNFLHSKKLVGRITSPHNLISQIQQHHYIVIGHNRQDFYKIREVSFREDFGGG
jgi:hypothetical protein